MCLTQNPDAIPAKPFLKYPKVSIPLTVTGHMNSTLTKFSLLRLFFKVLLTKTRTSISNDHDRMSRVLRFKQLDNLGDDDGDFLQPVSCDLGFNSCL